MLSPETRAEMKALATGFRGRIGFYIEDLTTGEHYGHAENERFPTGSVIKLPVW